MKHIFNIANIITILRVIYSFIFGLLIFIEDINKLIDLQWFILYLFLFMSLTDKIDGFIARKLNIITLFGKLLDPIADKLLIGTSLIFIAKINRLNWIIVSLFLIRELAITFFRFINIKKINIQSSKLGKLKTFSQNIFICLYLLPNSIFEKLNFFITNSFLYLSLFITLISGLFYIFNISYLSLQNKKCI